MTCHTNYSLINGMWTGSFSFLSLSEIYQYSAQPLIFAESFLTLWGSQKLLEYSSHFVMLGALLRPKKLFFLVLIMLFAH